jgi:hypothetical protein
VKKNFKLHAILLRTINDFPAYAMLSGWSMKGKFACSYYHKDTDYLWLKYGSKHCYMGHRRFLLLNHRWWHNKSSFNNELETREPPVPLSGEQVSSSMKILIKFHLGRQQQRGSGAKKKLDGTTGERRVFSFNYHVGKNCLPGIIWM